MAWEKAKTHVRDLLGEDYDRLSSLLNRLVEILEYKVWETAQAA